MGYVKKGKVGELGKLDFFCKLIFINFSWGLSEKTPKSLILQL